MWSTVGMYERLSSWSLIRGEEKKKPKWYEILTNLMNPRHTKHSSALFDFYFDFKYFSDIYIKWYTITATESNKSVQWLGSFYFIFFAFFPLIIKPSSYLASYSITDMIWCQFLSLVLFSASEYNFVRLVYNKFSLHLTLSLSRFYLICMFECVTCYDALIFRSFHLRWVLRVCVCNRSIECLSNIYIYFIFLFLFFHPACDP